MKDIILIGMPGCGKSTIGKLLAEEIKRPLVDLDCVIEELAGKTIGDIFKTVGEAGFRELETEAFRNTVGEGKIIATGGGIVTIPQNRDIARKGLVVFLDRPLEILLETTDTSKRPLLKDGRERLKILYQERYDLYSEWADIRIENVGILKDVVKNIINEVNHYENYGD